MVDSKPSARKGKKNKSSLSKRRKADSPSTPDNISNDNVGDNMECPWGDGYVASSQASLRGHIMRVHQQGAKEPDTEGPSRIQPDNELTELVNEKKRLKLQAEIKTLQAELDKVDGGSPDHHLQQKVNELQQQLNRRDMQDLIKGFDRKFEILTSRVDAIRENSHQPVQTDDRHYRDLSQMIFRLEKELQQRDSDELRRQLHILTERIEGAEKGSGRPQPYEVEASQNRDFLVYSTEIGKQVLHSLDGMRKDLHDSRREIIDAIKPFATTLGERMLGAKLQEAAKHEEYQPTERELSPEQLERLNSQLEQELGPDYLDHISEEELEDRAARELERIQEEAMAQYMVEDAEEGEIDPDDIPLDDEPEGDEDDDESET